jgi:hypothetical protein
MPLRCRGRYRSLRRPDFPSNILLSKITASRVTIPIEEIGIRGLSLPW